MPDATVASMRLGCLGCLCVLGGLILFASLAAGALFFSANIFEALDVQPTPFSASDGYRAQQKLYEVVLREGQRSVRREPIVLSEREINAFLSRHLLDTANISFSLLSVSLLPDSSLEIRGRTTLRALMQGFPFAQLALLLPDGKLDEPVWVRVRGRLVVERGQIRREREYARLDVSEFALGTQPLSVWILQAVVRPGGQNVLRWQIPTVVESIGIENGRLLIKTALPS
jgi:hypothetical protein